MPILSDHFKSYFSNSESQNPGGSGKIGPPPMYKQLKGYNKQANHK